VCFCIDFAFSIRPCFLFWSQSLAPNSFAIADKAANVIARYKQVSFFVLGVVLFWFDAFNVALVPFVEIKSNVTGRPEIVSNFILIDDRVFHALIQHDAHNTNNNKALSGTVVSHPNEWN
jgi:hypothetical protein